MEFGQLSEPSCLLARHREGALMGTDARGYWPPGNDSALTLKGRNLKLHVLLFAREVDALPCDAPRTYRSF